MEKADSSAALWNDKQRMGRMADVAGVTMDEVLRVAELANLDLTAEEVPRMQRDLNAILGHIAQLNELDTTGVPAMAQVGEMLGAAVESTGASLRVDAERVSLDRAAVMAAAPESDSRFFKVPKVIER
jgi:aspartyl-tRNA(Asn)/glutamyl-tRNA(Gln) amidotransferase subunit C